MDKERILQKIKRCLALSQSANENEAAMALRQAHALMQKHGVSMSDMSMADIDTHNTKATVARKPAEHQGFLIDEIATLFGCKPLITIDEKWRTVVKFVGFDAHPQIASYAFDVLSRQLNKARKEYLATELKRVRKRAVKTARANSYCIGWVYSVSKKIEDLVPPQVDHKLIEKYVDEQMNVKSSTSTRKNNRSLVSKRTQYDDMSNGVQDGKKAQLHNAMGASEAKQIGAAHV